MENYEKLYQKALEAVKELLSANPSDEGVQNWVYDNFPELIESEDEKIRKELADFIYASVFPTEKLKQKEKFLAWLEKQTDEPKWCHHKVDLSGCSEEYRKAYYDGWNNCNLQHSQRLSDSNDVVKCLINGMKFYYEGNEEATWGTEKFSMKVKDILAWLEKQGEQKSIQTPQWMINFLDGYRRNIGCALSYDECKEVDGKILSIIEWLKGNHNIEQNPVEWNEEDDRMLQTLVLGIGNYTYFSGIQSEDAVNWLKSLKQKFKEE